MKATRDDILELLKFYRGLGRPLTLLEIHRLLPSPDDIELFDLENMLVMLASQNLLRAEDGFYMMADADGTSLQRRMQDLVLDMKWKRFLKLARWLRIVPFVDFALASGSMALGNVTAQSDFDVLVAVRRGRMFTTRYFLNLLFMMLGARRMNDLHDADADKLCFNHFVTEATYAKIPQNFYRQQLHKNMVPLIGSRAAILGFLKANAWAGTSERITWDRRYDSRSSSRWKKLFEFLFAGAWGDVLERHVFKPIAKRRLARYVASKPKGGRVVVEDKELEFHFDTSEEKRFGELPSRWSLT